MSLELARSWLEQFGFADRIIIPEQSSATVEEAAAALGCEPGMIAKTLSFLQGDQPVLILVEGMARIDNPKYKARFGCKAKMIPFDEVEERVGHCVGGVCPFGIKAGVKVYLDESLKLHETVYPAAGSDHSAVRLSLAELEKCTPGSTWIDVCKMPSKQE